MSPSRLPLALATLAALGGCALAPPTGPMVLAMPPQGKDLARFQQEDAACRQYASAQIGGGSPALAANQAAVGSAALGTALGAGAGALFGSAGGALGTGAAIGAGTGLLLGSAIGAGNAQASGLAMQQAYDVAYAQCMASSGNTVQAGVLPPPASASAYYGYGVPYALPYATPAYPYPYFHGPDFYGPGVTFGWGWEYRPWSGYYWGRRWRHRHRRF